MRWLYPANTRFYDVLGAFARPQTFWPVNSKVEPGDVIYIYLAAPHQQIAFVCDVVETGFDLDQIIDDLRPFFKGDMGDGKPGKTFMKLARTSTIALQTSSPLSYQYLKQNGLNGMLMGPRKLENNPQLLAYIEGNL